MPFHTELMTRMLRQRSARRYHWMGSRPIDFNRLLRMPKFMLNRLYAMLEMTIHETKCGR